jgi:hypothetical protein
MGAAASYIQHARRKKESTTAAPNVEDIKAKREANLAAAASYMHRARLKKEAAAPTPSVEDIKAKREANLAAAASYMQRARSKKEAAAPTSGVEDVIAINNGHAGSGRISGLSPGRVNYWRQNNFSAPFAYPDG